VGNIAFIGAEKSKNEKVYIRVLSFMIRISCRFSPYKGKVAIFD
jgi:hypothetical protein